jgi:hypothetical protein
MIGLAMCRAVPGACAVLLLAGCGSDRKDDARDTGPPVAGVTQQTTPAITPPREQQQPSAPRLPSGVPRRATAAADPRDTRVVKRWSAALRAGKVTKAASYFAQPSRIQNSSPVITLRSRSQRIAFNLSLPCGALPTRYGAAKGFTIVTFKLTERVGGNCRGAAGNKARCAIRVRDGRITDWYRLADPAKSKPKDQPLSTVGGEA